MINRKFITLAFCSFFVSQAALAQALPAPPPTAPTVAPATTPIKTPVRETPEQKFARMDSNQDSMISLEEFKVAMEAQHRAVVISRLQRQFSRMDVNKSAAIESNEFANLPIVRRKDLNAPSFADADSNGDAKLDFKEYVTLVGKVATANQNTIKKP